MVAAARAAAAAAPLGLPTPERPAAKASALCVLSAIKLRKSLRNWVKEILFFIKGIVNEIH